MHPQSLRSADRMGFQLCFCNTNQHLKHYIAFAVWRARFDQNVILHESSLAFTTVKKDLVKMGDRI